MHLTFLNFVLVVTGLLIHVLMKLIKIQKKHGDAFDLNIYLKHNYLQLIASTLCAFVVMFFADNISEGILDIHIHHESNYYQIYAVAAGFNNQVLFNDLMKKNK